MIPPPPRSPLFPYTTLFRSREPHRENNERDIGRCWLVLAAVDADAGEHERQNRRDRKSTRLNSSHVSISYAVFCLKKKINYAHLHMFLLHLYEQRYAKFLTV